MNIFDAITNGDLGQVVALIEGNPSLVRTNRFKEDGDGNGYKPLHHATNAGHIAIIDFLLKRGADIEAKDSHHSTPLHYAASAPGHL